MRPGRARRSPPKRNLRRRPGARMAATTCGATPSRSPLAIPAMARRLRLAPIPRASAPTGRWIWPATCGSGARIGMTRIIMPARRRTILRGLRLARHECCAAAVGVSMWRSSSGSPTGIAVFPGADMATMASDASSRRRARGRLSTPARRRRPRLCEGQFPRREALNQRRFLQPAG